MKKQPYAIGAAAVAKLRVEWHEDDGPVLWWKFPIVEPPYVGTPLDCGRTVAVQIIGADDPMLQTKFDVGGWPGYHTHWTRIVVPDDQE